MGTVSKEEYPKHRDWEAKVFSLPKIPRGHEGQPVVLRKILKAIIDKTPLNTVLTFHGSNSKATLEHLCRWLRPIGLVFKSEGTWKISKEGTRYLETEDDLYLTAIFCANIRFIGELLVSLTTPKNINDLLKIATEKYKLNWDTNSEIGNRLTWLRQLDLVYHNDFKHTYSLTEKGKLFINEIEIVSPEDIKTLGDPTLTEEDLPVSLWAKEVIKSKKNRKPSIGYIPGNLTEISSTLEGYVQLTYEGCDKDTFINYSKETYGIAISSANSFITTLININFLERTSRTTYKASELAKKWIRNNSILDLVYCFHAKIKFVLELLNELKVKPLDIKELAVIAKVSYGFDTERVDEIRKRINILESAFLVYENKPNKYTLTKRGKKVLATVPINEEETNQENKSKERNEVPENVKNTLTDNLLGELRLASKDSTNPNRFEKAIQKAFSLLGFHAKWLGGSGKTDVLIHSPNIAKYSYAVTVDAKSTMNGAVNESQINFDTLKDHKRIHKADYIAVVGYSFQGERLIKRSINHNVALIDIDSLETIIKNHNEIPLNAAAYKNIFSQAGKVDISVLENDRYKNERSGNLLQSVIECLVEESFDPITEGLLQEKEIYRTLRNDAKFDTPPSIDEISEMLQFLSSPLIGCVGKSKENYFAQGTILDAQNKLNFYSKSCLKN